MFPTLLVLLGCADPEPPTNPWADRPVTRPEACADGPAKRLSVIRRDGGGLPSSVRVGWRASEVDPWREVGRVEGASATAALPGGGEAMMLGIGAPSCVQQSTEEGAPVDLWFLTPRSRGWECVRDVRVVDASGAPVAGAEVWMAGERKGRLRGALVGWTEADGWARELPAPCALAAAGAVVGGTGVWGPLTQEATAVVTLPEPTARLHGRVRSGEAPVAGARVTLVQDDGDDLPDQPMPSVAVWTDADGRWSAALALADDHDRVRLRVEAKGFVDEVETLPLRSGQDRAKYVDLAPARRVHLRCIGGPEDSCDDGGNRSLRCGAPGDLGFASGTWVGVEGRRQLSVECPDVPGLRVSLDGVEAVVYDDVAWFDQP